ncbi:type VI secretion system-associated protein TagF [Methylocapsa aurea]|uniref:type VI secretion system-associated protein TagF n=1 Tax=Methylocapsa aurea TaxID=663610 RepID=UPI000689409C|nr:type VI secretion system-associated protein TagF [Methylocapsa aurea]
MRCGLFGKLPAKRDFFCLETPRAFLRLWEPWLEKGMAEGRARFGAQGWKEAFLSAPIWRFWLGPDLCGAAMSGAFMPSTDALGRLFPLTLIGIAGKGETIVPPDVDPRDPWYERAENILLGALDPGPSCERAEEALAGLGALARGTERGKAGGEENPSRRRRGEPDIGEGAGVFAQLRRELTVCPAGAATFWWTSGGADCEPLAWMQERMPAPGVFTDMLTVRAPHRPKKDVTLGMSE